METDSHEHDVEDLLRQVFDEARREGARDLSGVHAAAWAEARRLRRRRRQRAALTGVGSGLVAATVVAAVVLATNGTDPRASELHPAATSGTTSAGGHERRLTPVREGQPGHAYGIPDVVPDPLPAGVSELALAPSQVEADTGDVVGIAGFCDWHNEAAVTMRLPVAGHAWRFQTDDVPDTDGASLGIAGFTTGTGVDALRDFRADALACGVSTDLDPVPWQGREGHDAYLWSGTFRDEIGSTMVLAVRRVGDLLVGSTARTKRPEDARRIATSFVDSAVSALQEQDFPPARGAALGASEQAPNPASRPGAPVPTPLRSRPVYRVNALFPSAAELPTGLEYREEQPSFDSSDIAPVMGAHTCDPASMAAKDAGQEKGARPVAGSNQTAWQAGAGLPDAAAELTVTGWARGTGAARFKDLQENQLFCVWTPSQTRVAWPGTDPASTWLSHATVDGLTQYVAARRVGDLVVAATVKDSQVEQARQRAVELATAMAAAAESSGLAAAEGK